jgi:hypothetical protein
MRFFVFHFSFLLFSLSGFSTGLRAAFVRLTHFSFSLLWDLDYQIFSFQARYQSVKDRVVGGDFHPFPLDFHPIQLLGVHIPFASIFVSDDDKVKLVILF